MTFEDIHAKLTERFGEAIGEIQPALDPFVVVAPDQLHDVCLFLRDQDGLRMDLLQDETAVDDPKDGRIRVVYHLWSYALKHGFKLKVECDRADPKVDTIEDVWPVGNWYEREIHDLFGVDFVGHPDLRPLMLPDDWEGRPLLKDYEEPEGYHGISHFRLSPLEGFARLDALKIKAAEAAAAEAGADEDGSAA